MPEQLKVKLKWALNDIPRVNLKGYTIIHEHLNNNTIFNEINSDGKK
jgi:hypothetical protein